MKKKIKTLTIEILKGIKPETIELNKESNKESNKEILTTRKNIKGGAYEKLKNVDLNKKPIEKKEKVKKKFIEIKL